MAIFSMEFGIYINRLRCSFLVYLGQNDRARYFTSKQRRLSTNTHML
jgi:hypothetical protein